MKRFTKILVSSLLIISFINIRTQTYAKEIPEDVALIEQIQGIDKDSSVSLSNSDIGIREQNQKISDNLIDKKDNIILDENPPFEPPLPKASKNPQVSEETTDDFFKTSLYTGSATYTYPIEVPPGTNKLTPNLSLNYQSSAAIGRAELVGLGWDLGLSYIQRDVRYTPNDTSDDKYILTLEGSTYDLVYISSEDRYYTKIESNLWIKKITGAPNQKGEYWIIREENGKEYRFGYNIDSENMAPTRDYVWRWSLDEIKDPNGNKIFFRYRENPYPNDIGAVYPYQIKYNNEQRRLIDFVLEETDRPDFYIFYDQGSKIQRSRRLKEINTYVDGGLVRKYRLNYSISPNSNRSLLSSIIQYGCDGISSLPPMSFTYQTKDFGFDSGSGWSNPGGNIRMGDEASISSDTFDINRDGLVDYVKSFNGGNWRVKPNNGSGFGPEIDWPAPGHWTHFSESLSSYDTFDINGDGLPDLVDASGNPNWRLYLNNGSGFDSQIVWAAPEAWLSYNTDDSVKAAIYDTLDINGDNLPDFVRSPQSGSNWRVDFNTGNGFSSERDWVAPPAGYGYLRFAQVEGSAPEIFTYSDTFDINGDWLPDFVHADSPNSWLVYLNNGDGFDTGISWPHPFSFWGIRYGECAGTEFLVYYDTLDLNGDGLLDFIDTLQRLIYFNNGKGFNSPISWSAPNYWIQDGEFFSAWDKVVDLNGDGLLDFVKSWSGWNLYQNKMSAVDLLTGINSPSGGTITISYGPSTDYDNRGSDNISDLGFVKWCVSSVTKDNGMAGAHNTHSTYTYNYADGLYDYQDEEFRGFGYVKVTEPIGNFSENYFYQNDARKGKCYKIENKDNLGNIYNKTEYVWNYQVLYSNPEEVYFTYLSEENNYGYDGNPQNPKVYRIEYPVYDSYANVLQIIYQGDIDIQTDEKFVYNEYVYNPDLWIVDKLKHVYANSSDNLTKVKESWYAYDNGQIGDLPTEGNLTRLEDWLDTGTGNPITTYLYDDFVNQTHITDPENHTTITTYDDVFHTFAVQIKNAKNQITTNTYDVATGKPLSTTDPNGFTISYEYDIFKRLIKEIRPYDNNSYPTVSYQYFVDGSAPEGVLISKREINGQPGTLDTYNFYDGFNKLIQTRNEAEDITKEIVTDTFYNPQEDIDRISVPYLADKINNYSLPNLSTRCVSYQYDPIRRIIRTINTDGTYKTNNYFHWVISSLNEKGILTDFTYDAYKRLVKVQEHNQQELYTTTYLYNTLDKLTQIIDAQGNQTIMEYDSLGRRIILNDPDMGIWHYTYDKANNLISKTDALGRAISYEYDELNRIRKKDYSTGIDAVYTYDTETIGTLSQMTDSSGQSHYYYDNRKRLMREERTLDSVIYTTQWSYDSLDRTISITYPNSEQVDFTYNLQGKIETILNYVNNVDYNAQGKIARKEYANSIITELTYNEDDFRLNRIYSAGVQDLTFGYDDCGNTTSIVDAIRGVTQTFQYDELNRLIYADGLYGEKIYSYDSIGNIILKDGTIYTYGQSAGPHALTSGSDGSTFSYDANGNMTKKGNFELTYDVENRLTKVEDKSTTQPVTISISLSPGWNFVSLPVIPADNSVSSVLYSITDKYDQVSRYNPDTKQFEHYVGNSKYDQFNISEYGKGYQIYIRQAEGCVLEVTGTVPQTTQSLNLKTGYNLIFCPKTAETPVEQALLPLELGSDYSKVLHYNKQLALFEKYDASVQEFSTLKPGEGYYIYCLKDTTWQIDNAGPTTTFVYDGDGGRVKQTNQLTNQQTIYIGSLFEKDSSGKTTKHIFLEKERIISKTQNNIYYYHSDHIGSSDVITDQTAAQIQHLEYAPYGEVILNEGQDVTDYKFTGKELDETGLYFYGARYYDAQIGRFTIADSVEPDIDKPQSLNRYSYCLNNPLTFIDPNGNWPISEDEDRDEDILEGWGSNLADMLDESIEEAFSFYTEDITGNWIGVATIATIADVLKGSTVLLRLGESSAEALDYLESGQEMMAMAKFCEDISKAASISAIVASLAYSTRPFYQYYPSGDEGYISPYLTRGSSWSTPYKAGQEAYQALRLDLAQRYNPGTAVRSVQIKSFEPIRGPRPVEGGTGVEYYRGWGWPRK